MSQQPGFSHRRIAVPAYGPSLVGSIGTGAINPVLALAARDLGASVSVAALIVALPVVGEFLVALPVGQLVDRLGERLVLTVGALLEAVIAVIGFLAGSVWVLGLAAVLLGPTSAVFILARQSFMAQVVPIDQRARALSTLGGVTRIGWFAGPLLAAPLIDVLGPGGAFVVLGLAGVLAAALTWFTMDLPELVGLAAATRPAVLPLRVTVRRHARVFLTIGLGVSVIGLARAARVVVVPLWCEHIGLSATQVSLLFGATYGLEMLLFYPAGWVMDRFGRAWVAVPVAVVLGIAMLALPLTATLPQVTVAVVAMAVANGMSSGLVMTIGADLAPSEGRAAFLGVWRWLSLVGVNGASLIVAVVAAGPGLGVASVVVGAIALVGGGWLARWVPTHDPRRARGIPDPDGGERVGR